MKRFLLIGLAILFILNIAGCSSEAKKTENSPTPPSKIDKNSKEEKLSITNDEYKENLVKSYEKYIKPLDLKDYDDIEDILLKKEKMENDKILNDLKVSLNDSKINIKSFEESITGLEIEDNNLRVLNDNLVNECKILMEDIKIKEDKILKIDKDIIKKSTEEFIQYLKINLDDDITEKNKIDDTLDKIENLLGIDLES